MFVENFNEKSNHEVANDTIILGTILIKYLLPME